MNVLEGKLVAGKGKFAIVAARFNEFIVSKLIAGAEDTLVRHGVDTDDITLAWVPGAFEIPLAAQKLAQSEQYCAVICWALSYAVRLRTMIMCATRFPRVLRRWACRPAYPCCSAWLRPRTLSRPSSVRVPKRATRVRTRLWRRWSLWICFRSCADPQTKKRPSVSDGLFFTRLQD
mgnify:CR=1 FL=1